MPASIDTTRILSTDFVKRNSSHVSNTIQNMNKLVRLRRVDWSSPANQVSLQMNLTQRGQLACTEERAEPPPRSAPPGRTYPVGRLPQGWTSDFPSQVPCHLFPTSQWIAWDVWNQMNPGLHAGALLRLRYGLRTVSFDQLINTQFPFYDPCMQ